MRATRRSYFEATARQRVSGIADPGSFKEICGPTERRTSPSLPFFGLPAAFDDGVVVGDALIGGRPVSLAAQEGRFMGGAFGEVHAAKVAGLLRRALRTRPEAFVFLLDSGGVRLQEANAGEIGVTEIMRAIFDLRHAGVPVIGVVGGSCGSFGGAGIVSGCCDTLIASQEGRMGVSGPEVIETTMGVEAFDSRDRALVWRTTGGKNRRLFGAVSALVEDHIPAFREALLKALDRPASFTLEALAARRAALKARFETYGSAGDALDIWRAMGFDRPEDVPAMDVRDLEARLEPAREETP
ncbi:Malonyl-S-ACP:biotin-protein carboxyltransferase MADC [Fundidesulfovibrio magnetotacticus]|uniref:Malonyl-S-ACP:biotin-protein carboxyltransferase MADC n=1 Tax=Fundidesulfovibrio magnetotacticus TaxID=2730080 RepID=A0A6V8LJS8_9BACT|nr:biotin-independent malonate decarboxylase subunit beta [Fundidesulfovibrio magnetotacticus]GFK92973.1 Malonyl-S-ACP:biotin-protein carboxyltransferase MADC [Fundidesulfovibrio magnetotacticus]